MPVQQFRGIGVIVGVHDDALTFPEAQERAGKLAIVEGGGDDLLRCEFDQSLGDANTIVSLRCCEGGFRGQ